MVMGKNITSHIKLLGLAALLSLIIAAPQKAQAICVLCTDLMSENSDTRDLMNDEHDETREHFNAEFDSWEEWLENTFTPPWLEPLYDMAEQMTTTMVYQVFAIGTLLDAKQELEVQRILQKRVAEAQRDYQPSVGVCSIGTTIRSLATAERRAETTTFVLSQRAQDRQLGNMHAAAAGGRDADIKARIEQMRARYCDTRDANNQFDDVCGSGNGGRQATLNKDLDYTRTVETPRTLNIDFTDTTATDDEIDVLALASNLYSHDIPDRIKEKFYNMADETTEVDRIATLLDQRSIVAKRSIAEHSYNTIVGMKAYGSPDSGDPLIGSSVDTTQYLRVVLEQLGMSAADITNFLGEQPSYFAQMEVITKKAFQQPGFYADLYDKPTNVDRKKVALQAISLMQDFDTWQSYLRTEAMLSVLLELEVEKYQGAVEIGSTRGNR